ncbi:Mediator complex subunit 23 [Aphelenchoides besseyi]|nr:Mediator complex subunit 23 [Aphelenchoides besseyi]
MQFEHSTGSTTSLPVHPIQRLDAEKLNNQQKALIMIEKNIQQILKQHVQSSPMTGMFEQFICYDATDEITCLEIMTIIKKLEPNEKETVVDSMVRFLQNAQTNLIQLDQIVTKILLALYHEEVMPVLPIAYGLINTLDMKFTVPIDSRKVCFVREHLHQIGYKGMRDLLKLVLIEKLDQLQTRLTEFQRLQLIPLEDLMLDLLDRRRNFCPSLFVITEVSRIRNTSNVYILPRLSRAIREFVVSFRPLAEVNSVICRSWLYPITGSLIYSWFGNNWRLAEQNFRIYFKTHLPYGTDLLSAQSNFQFMLLKQPRGQTNLHHMSKVQSTYHPKAAHPPISKYNEIIHVLILEAMNAMETTTLPIKAEVNQFNWRHIFHLVSFALCTNYCNFPDLMKDINEQLKVSKFRKARSELMWMILQYTSLSIAKQVPKMKLILEVFNSLYPDTMCWTGSSDDTWEMTRFFAPASIWIMSSKNSEPNQPPAPENLDRLLKYLKDLINTGKEHKPTDLALIANAYSKMDDVFQAEVLLPILKRLNCTGHLPSYHLPYGIETNGELECLELNFLEALTFHAKQILCQNLYSNIQNISQNRKLPSPAIIETITRISLKTEPIGVHTRSFAVLFLNQIQNHKQRTEDPNINLILYDLLVYRLKNAIFSINNRVVFINCAFEDMPKPNQLVIEKFPLYILMEQAIIRQFMVAAPYDLLTMTAIFVYRSLKNQSTASSRFNLFPAPNEVNESEGYFAICPEVTKLLCIHFAMAYKMTADYPNEKSFVTDCVSEMNKTQKWPRCSLRWFPQHMKAQEDAELDVQLCANYEKSTDDEQQHMWNSGGVYTTRPPVTYIKMMPIRNFTENLNALIKYVIWQAQILSKDNDYDQIINALYQIIFVRQYVPFERFFFALILHPNDNESIRISLIILYGLLQKQDVDKTRGIMKRLEMLYKILPSNANLLSYNSAEYFKKMFEYRREFGDYDLEKLSDGNDADGTERILPVVDILFLRSFEVKIDKPVLEQFLKAFAPVYRYHRNYVLDGLTPSENLRRLVGVVCKHLEDDKHSPRYSFLSQEFVIQQHKMPAVKICNVIAERVVAASTYNHQPPDFVARDWRIAEFAPAAQALISGCLELMVSSKEAQEIVDGLIEVSMSKPVKRPTDRLNAVAMLLCNLPKRFQYIFFKKSRAIVLLE